MIFGFVIFVFIVCFVAFKQYREGVNRKKRFLINEYLSELERIDSLILDAKELPHSKHLVLAINRLKLNIIDKILKNSNEYEYRNKFKVFSEQRALLNDTYVEVEPTFFNVPDNKEHALTLIKCVRKLEKIIKKDYSNGLINHGQFKGEMERLTTITFKINMDNGLARLRAMIVLNKLEQAEEMLIVLSDYSKANNTEYSQQSQTDIKDLYLEISDRKQKINEIRGFKVVENEKEEETEELLQLG